MKTSIGTTSIEVASGDIIGYEADALAVAATGELDMRTGLAAAMKAAGGEGIETEAMLQGPIQVGEAVLTTGHALTAGWVIHAAVLDADRHTDAAIVAKATASTLAQADSAHARTLAMPAFGTGVAGFPLYQCATIMLAETVRYLHEHDHSGLRHIVFVTSSDAAKAAFTNALTGLDRS
jgi:O-acetyl-ADP-ribose deacetylase